MVKRAMPEVALSTDVIVGFCTETLEDHEMTKRVMEEVGYEGAYMFNYSPRPNTRANDTLEDDVPLAEKTRRLQELIVIQREIAGIKNQVQLGTKQTVLVEGRSKKDADQWKGRTDTNWTVVFPRMDAEVGEYRSVEIVSANAATLIGRLTDVRRAEHSTPEHGLDRGDVLYDLTPLVISNIEPKEHIGIAQPAAMFPILS